MSLTEQKRKYFVGNERSFNVKQVFTSYAPIRLRAEVRIGFNKQYIETAC